MISTRTGIFLAAALLLAACGPGNNTSKNNDTNNGTVNNTNNGTVNNSNNGTDNNTSNNTSNNVECLDVICEDETPVCEGDTLVTYEEDSDNCCGVRRVDTDCAADGQICMDGACVEEDECALVDCEPTPDPSCDGEVAVTYEDMPEACCPVEVRIDCSETDQLCSTGTCIDMMGGVTPAAGDIHISEFMKNPVAVGDDAGEWVELYNSTEQVLDLAGLKLRDTGGDEVIFPSDSPILLPPTSYFVAATSDDEAVNGGIPADLALGADFALGNGSDEIILVDANDVELDRVEYNNTDWPDPTGLSIQFGANFDITADDNNDAQFWCFGSGEYGDGDFGTPGAPNVDCTAIPATVQELGDENAAGHPAIGQNVNVTGLAISAIDTAEGHIFAQDPAGGEYSGLYINAAQVDITALVPGDIVDISGAYIEDFGSLVTVAATAVTDTGNDMTVAPELLESSVLSDPATADAWEGVLVQIAEAGVTTEANNFGEAIVDGSLVVDDLLFDGFTSAAVCEVYASITGPLNYSFGAHKLLPRDAADLGTAVAATATTDVTSIATTGWDPTYICITAGDTVTWTNPTGIPHTVTERLASEESATNTPANPQFDEQLPGNSTATVTFADSGTFHYRCTPHAAMEGAVIVPD